MGPEKLELELAMPTGAELLRRVYPNGGLGGVRLDGLPPLGVELGTPVVLNISIQKPQERAFRVRGHLAWVRHKGAARLQEAYGIDFSEQDATGRNRLLQFAQEELPPEASRHDERFTLELPVLVTLPGAAKPAAEHFCDLSVGGAFVRTRTPPAVGDTVQLRFRPPLSLRKLQLEGKVTWVRRGEEPRGMGVCFSYHDERERQRIYRLVERLRRRKG